MTESTTLEGSDIAASELMEKFDISEEQAAKIAKALPELCKEFSKEEPDQRQQQYPAPQITLSPDMLAELEKFAQASAEEMFSTGDFIMLEDVLSMLDRDLFKDLGALPLNNVTESINAALDVIEAEGEEEEPDDEIPDEIGKKLSTKNLLGIVSRLLAPLRSLRAQPRRQYPYPYPYPYPSPAPGRTTVGRAVQPLRGSNVFTASADANSKPIYTDSIHLNLDVSSITVGEDGVLKAGCVATAAMVQDYDGMKVLKCPDELALAVDYARQLPIGHNHPQDGIITEQDQIKGWTTPVTYDEKNQRISCDVEIGDDALVKDIRDNKKTDVSIGFFCDLDKTPGEFKGEKYDAVQRNIVLNHLAAGIDSGRCPGGTCGIGQDKVKDCETCPDKETCTSKDKTTKVPATDGEPSPDASIPAVDKLGEDATVEMHEKLLQEQVDAIKALSNKIAEGATTMKADELSALASQLSDITYEIRNTARVVQTKNLGVDSQLLTDATKEISEAWKIATDILSKPLVDAKYMLEETEDHTHTADLNEKGDGTSSKDNDHFHKIIGSKVMFTNGHTHKLKKAGDEGDQITPEEEKRAMTLFKLSKEEWDKLSDAEKAALIKKLPPAEKTDTDPPPEEKTDAEKALDLKQRETVDAIMDFNPPEPRETYEAMDVDELDKTLALIKSQSTGGSIHRSGSSTTDRRLAIDKAYDQVEKNRSGKK